MGLEQQNTIVSQKLRMYVSWRVILLNFFVVVCVANIPSLFQPDYERWRIGLLLTLTCLPIGIVLLLIMAVLKKPIGYVNIKNMNSILWICILLPLPFLLLIAGLQDTVAMGPELGTFPWTSAYIIFAIIGVWVTSVIINFKFQKPETELKISSS